MKNLLSLLTISFFCQQLYAQIVCSAPYSAEEISSSRNAIWVLGQSDEKGRGVFKLENGTWFFYDQPQAINLSATNNNEPLVINNNKELFIFRGTWQQIGSNISKVIGSKNSGNIWAIRDNNLKFYRNNNWYDSSYDAMYISDIAEDQSGNLYALNNTGYVFKAVGSAWQIMGNKKGEAINAGYQGEILLISNEMQNNGNNVYINTNGSWSLYPEQAKKISAGLNQVVYFIDNLGVLYSMRGGVKKKITKIGRAHV